MPSSVPCVREKSPCGCGRATSCRLQALPLAASAGASLFCAHRGAGRALWAGRAGWTRRALRPSWAWGARAVTATTDGSPLQHKCRRGPLRSCQHPCSNPALPSTGALYLHALHPFTFTYRGIGDTANNLHVLFKLSIAAKGCRLAGRIDVGHNERKLSCTVLSNASATMNCGELLFQAVQPMNCPAWVVQPRACKLH